MNLYLILKSLFLALLLSSQVFSFEIKHDTDMIKAMGYGMSKMRNMLETYAMVGMGISYKNPKKRLFETIYAYEEIIDTLQKNYQDAKIQESVSRSKKAWIPLKKAFECINRGNTEQMKKDALFAHANIRAVIKEMALVKKYLVEKSPLPDIKALNAAIEIATSSQRLSAHYMMRLWELDDPTIQKHWDKGLAIYRSSVVFLKHSVYYRENKIFKKALDDCEKTLVFYNFAFAQKTGIGSLVDKKSNRVFLNANTLIKIIIP